MSESPTMLSSLLEHLELARTLRGMRIFFDAEKCTGVLQCYAVCPVDCWAPDPQRHKVKFVAPDRCIACGACVLQCPEQAIELK